MFARCMELNNTHIAPKIQWLGLLNTNWDIISKFKCNYQTLCTSLLLLPRDQAMTPVYQSHLPIYILFPRKNSCVWWFLSFGVRMGVQLYATLLPWAYLGYCFHELRSVTILLGYTWKKLEISKTITSTFLFPFPYQIL